MTRKELTFQLGIVAELADVEDFGGLTPAQLAGPLLALGKACRETDSGWLGELLGLPAAGPDGDESDPIAYREPRRACPPPYANPNTAGGGRQAAAA